MRLDQLGIFLAGDRFIYNPRTRASKSLKREIPICFQNNIDALDHATDLYSLIGAIKRDAL